IRPARAVMWISALIAAIAAIASIIPYIALSHIAAIVLHQADGKLLTWVVVAVVSLLIGNLAYGFALGITHMGEAKLRYQLRRQLVATLGRIPLGAVDQTSSGAIRKMVVDDTA
ncbi:MAG: ABC transporter ATP-binding protein, partial [Bowdeniella nasicola]|nr:ABC transporter ATP-binding protein [Bowdeniella nasicola]